MAKVIYINPLDDTTIDFKPTFKFSSGPITVIGENKKNQWLENALDDENVFFTPEPKLFGEVKKYLLNKNTIKKLEIFAEEEIKEKSVIGRAIVGGILTGGIGAIVGGMSGLKTDYKGIRRIIINDKEFKIDDKNFKRVSDFFFTINKELEQKENDNKGIKTNENPIEKLKELKGLLDLGIITQEEFDNKKFELMKKI